MKAGLGLACTAIVFLGPVLAAGGDSAHLVGDLAPGSYPGAIRPLSAVPLGGETFLVAADASDDFQVWKRNAGGLRKITSIPDLGPRAIFADDEKILFRTGTISADSRLERAFLWRIDAGSDAAVLVTETPPSDGPFERAGSAFVFIASGETGQELWRTDGTSSGTRRLRRGDAAGGEATYGLQSAGNRSFFFVARDEHARLWVTDGTESGTRTVVDLGSVNGIVPQSAGESRNRFFFSTATPAGGFRLWVSDGDPAHTLVLHEFSAAIDGTEGLPHGGLALGGVYLFAADDGIHGTELWRTDATPGGTFLLKDLNPGTPGSHASPRVVASGVALVSALGPNHADTALWASDGTSAGTVHLRDVSDAYYLTSFLPSGPAAYFAAFDVATATVWVSDGSAAGTRPVFGPEELASPGDLTLLGGDSGDLDFVAPKDGRLRLWSTDGTGGGTRVVDDLAEGSSLPLVALGGGGPTVRFASATVVLEGSMPQFTSFLKDLRIGAASSSGEVGVSAAIPGDRGKIREISPFIGIGQDVFFVLSSDDGGVELWKAGAPGSVPQRVRALSPAPGPLYGADARFSEASDHVLFTTNGGDAHPGSRLWRSDGSAEGTVMIHDFGSSTVDGFSPFAAFRGLLLFAVDESDGTIDLWRSDGTPEGTRAIERVGVTGANGLLARGDRYFYMTQNGADGSIELRGSGPSGEETTLLALLPPETDPYSLAAAGNFLYFTAGAEARLRRTDTTPSGTIDLGVAGVRQLAAAGGRLAFLADDATHGVELWASDGSPEATRMIRDINPGPIGSDIGGFFSWRGALLFPANDGAAGSELWTTDGTPAGTRMVQEICPGVGSSKPAVFAGAGDLLYFMAEDGTHGRELWVMPAPPNGRRPLPVAPLPAPPKISPR